MTGTDDSLAERITSGDVPTPVLMEFNAWQKWRSGAGKRPKPSLGDEAPTTSRQESDLWKGTMERLYGAGWRSLLEDAQLAAAEAAEQEEPAEAPTPAPASRVGGTPAGGSAAGACLR